MSRIARVVVPGVAAYRDGQPPSEAAIARLRKAEQSGRPLGSPDFIESLERRPPAASPRKNATASHVRQVLRSGEKG